MDTLLALLLAIFIGVALMVTLGERFAKPMEPEQMQKLSRWIMPLVGIALIAGIVKYYLQ